MATELERVAHATGTTEVMDRVIQNLSKGFRQRVGLAQALLGAPPVLILDEPTEGLDPSQRAEVRELIKGLAGQHTVILSTHILPEVTMTCEKVLIINQGKMVAYDEIRNLGPRGWARATRPRWRTSSSSSPPPPDRRRGADPTCATPWPSPAKS